MKLTITRQTPDEYEARVEVAGLTFKVRASITFGMVGAHAVIEGHEQDPDAYAYNGRLREPMSPRDVLVEAQRAITAVEVMGHGLAVRYRPYVPDEAEEESEALFWEEAERAFARDREARAESLADDQIPF